MSSLSIRQRSLVAKACSLYRVLDHREKDGAGVGDDDDDDDGYDSL